MFAAPGDATTAGVHTSKSPQPLVYIIAALGQWPNVDLVKTGDTAVISRRCRSSAVAIFGHVFLCPHETDIRNGSG